MCFFLLISAEITKLEGCMNNIEPYRRQSRAHTNLLSERPYDQKTTNTLLTLNEGELSSVRPNLYASKGQILYGRCVITFLYTIMNFTIRCSWRAASSRTGTRMLGFGYPKCTLWAIAQKKVHFSRTMHCLPQRLYKHFLQSCIKNQSNSK